MKALEEAKSEDFFQSEIWGEDFDVEAMNKLCIRVPQLCHSACGRSEMI